MIFGDKTVEKAKKGDQSSLEKLYRENFKSLYIFVRHKVNTNEQAEDITGDAFVKAFENIGKFRNKSSFKTWLYTIAKNLIYDFYKANSKVSEIDQEIFDNTEDMDEDKSDMGDNTDNTDNTKQIKQLLSELPENYRTVLELRFIGNCNIKETAEIMKTSTGNVKVLQNRAIKASRQLVEGSKK